MGIDVPLQNNAINVAELEKLAEANPQYTKLFLGLTQIDAFIKNVCKDVVCHKSEPDCYSIKTELTSMSYSLYLFNSERNAIVGTTWPIDTFLEECRAKTIEYDVRTQIIRMLSRFGDTDLETGAIVNWI